MMARNHSSAARAAIGTSNSGCVIPLLILAASVVLAVIFHPVFLGGIVFAVISMFVIESRLTKRRTNLRRQVLDEIFSPFSEGVPEFSEASHMGESSVILGFPSKTSTHEAVNSGLLASYLQRMRDLDPEGAFNIETRYPGWTEERWRHEKPPEYDIRPEEDAELPEDLLNDGVFFRMTKVLALFVVSGSIFIFSLLRDSSIDAKLMVYGIIVALALVAWTYLEFRDFILHRKKTTGFLRWKLAAIAVHPSMLPIYTIALPILGVIIHAWWINAHS